MLAADGKYEFDGEVTPTASKKAILFRGDFWDKAEHECGVWLPLSQVEVEYEPREDRSDPLRANVLIPQWLARKNGLDDYD